MNKTPSYIIIILVLLSALIYLYLAGIKIDKDQKNAIRILETELKSTREQRDSIMVLINRSDSLSKALSKLIDKKDQELNKIKGRYNKYTVPELESEMERKANGK